MVNRRRRHGTAWHQSAGRSPMMRRTRAHSDQRRKREGCGNQLGPAMVQSSPAACSAQTCWRAFRLDRQPSLTACDTGSNGTYPTPHGCVRRRSHRPGRRLKGVLHPLNPCSTHHWPKSRNGRTGAINESPVPEPGWTQRGIPARPKPASRVRTAGRDAAATPTCPQSCHYFALAILL